MTLSSIRLLYDNKFQQNKWKNEPKDKSKQKKGIWKRTMQQLMVSGFLQIGPSISTVV